MNHLSGPAPAAKRNKRMRGTVRVAIVFLALCAQLLMLAYFVGLLRQNAVYLYFLLEFAGAVAVTVIVTKNRNSSYAINILPGKDSALNFLYSKPIPAQANKERGSASNCSHSYPSEAKEKHKLLFRF